MCVTFQITTRNGEWFAVSTVMRLASIVAMLLLALAGMADAAQQKRPVRRAHPYVRHWKQSMTSKRALAGVGAGAAVGQLRHSPKNYGGGAAGLGKRLGAGMATHAVGKTVEHVVAAPLHERLDYQRSTKSGVAPRLGHALKSTVVTTNTRSGKRTPAAGRIAGHAASGAVSQGVLAGASGAATAGLGLAADAGANVAREFWPRKKQPVRVARSRPISRARSSR
jgi:hypothetical protein